MAYFNNLAIGGSISSVPKFEDRIGFKPSQVFDTVITELNTQVPYGFVQGKIGLSQHETYIIRYYTENNDLVDSLEVQAEELELSNGDSAVVLADGMIFCVDGAIFSQQYEDDNLITDWTAADGYCVVHPKFYLQHNVGKLTMIIEGKNDKGEVLHYQEEIKPELDTEFLPSKLQAFINPEISYSSNGFIFNQEKAIRLDDKFGGYYFFPKSLNLKVGNTYQFGMIVPELVELPDLSDLTDFDGNMLAIPSETLPGAVVLYSEGTTREAFTEKMEKYGDKSPAQVAKKWNRKETKKGPVGVLIDGVVINENGEFELGDGLLLSNMFFEQIDAVKEYALSQGYGSDEQFELLTQLKIFLTGFDKFGKQLTSDVVKIPTYVANVTGAARTLGGLKTSIQELNNPCGQRTESGVEGSGEIFNDYANGNAIASYSHFEGKNTPETIHFKCSTIQGDPYHIICPWDVVDLFVLTMRKYYIINNQINSFKKDSEGKMIYTQPLMLVLDQDDSHLRRLHNVSTQTFQIYDENKNEISKAVARCSIAKMQKEETINKGTENESVKLVTTYHGGFIVDTSVYDLLKEKSKLYYNLDGEFYEFEVNIAYVFELETEKPVPNVKIWESTYNLEGSVVIKRAHGAFGIASHSEGFNQQAYGDYSHAQGQEHYITGECGFASGTSNYVSAANASALGFQLTAASKNQTVVGQYNDILSEDVLFGIGNGDDSNYNTCFSVKKNGTVENIQSVAAAGADYAEYYEWADGNPNNEDRRGLFVTFADEDKIRVANDKDTYILGVVSSNASIIGNSYTDRWQGKYLTDIYGKVLTEEIIHEEEIIRNEQEEVIKIIPAYTETRLVLNPEYDPEQEYVGRNARLEWTTIGTHGQLIVRDSGECVANSFCTIGENGQAVPATRSDYRVIKRLDDTHVKVVLK